MNLNEQIFRMKQMMGLQESQISLDEELNKITTGEAIKNKMFGPVYHGTTELRHEKIDKEGFKIFYGGVDQRNGYWNQEYGNTGYPPPVHHLGYGVYFTTVKNIGKKFNQNRAKNIGPYYINTTNIETINFASERKMMNWWMSNGYNAENAKESEAKRIEETKNLTDTLKSKYDAVWFKGKGFNRLLDGDQIVVFNPELIYKVDDSNVTGYEIGAKVVLVKDIKTYGYDVIDNKSMKIMRTTIPSGTKGVILDIRDIGEQHIEWLKSNQDFKIEDNMSQEYIDYWKEQINDKLNGDHKYYKIKFAKGGTEYNVLSAQFIPL